MKHSYIFIIIIAVVIVFTPVLYFAGKYQSRGVNIVQGVREDVRISRMDSLVRKHVSDEEKSELQKRLSEDQIRNIAQAREIDETCYSKGGVPTGAQGFTNDENCVNQPSDFGKTCYNSSDCDQICWPYYDKNNRPIANYSPITEGLQYDSEGYITGICSISTTNCPYHNNWLSELEAGGEKGPYKRTELYAKFTFPCNF